MCQGTFQDLVLEQLSTWSHCPQGAHILSMKTDNRFITTDFRNRHYEQNRKGSCCSGMSGGRAAQAGGRGLSRKDHWGWDDDLGKECHNKIIASTKPSPWKQTQCVELQKEGQGDRPAVSEEGVWEVKAGVSRPVVF